MHPMSPPSHPHLKCGWVSQSVPKAKFLLFMFVCTCSLSLPHSLIDPHNEHQSFPTTSNLPSALPLSHPQLWPKIPLDHYPHVAGSQALYLVMWSLCDNCATMHHEGCLVSHPPR